MLCGSSITDWLMVIITAFYAIFTICIFIANNQSVKAIREQIKESENEHKENLRVSVMPQLQYSVEKVANRKMDESNCDILGVLNITNIGIKQAVYLQVFTSAMIEGEGRRYIKYNQIHVAEKKELSILIYDFLEFPEQELDILILYSDLLYNHYAQCIKIGFESEYNKFSEDKTKIVTNILEKRDFWMFIDTVYAPEQIMEFPQTKDALKNLVHETKKNVLYSLFDKKQ